MAHEDVSDPTHDYYDIQLMGGGTLLVPVNCANVSDCVSSPEVLMPSRSACVRLCKNCPGMPGNGRPSCGHAVNRRADRGGHLCSGYGTQSHGRTLTASEKAWLDKSCERLSTEAALVDHISRSQAHAAIWEAVNLLSTT